MPCGMPGHGRAKYRQRDASRYVSLHELLPLHFLPPSFDPNHAGCRCPPLLSGHAGDGRWSEEPAAGLWQRGRGIYDEGEGWQRDEGLVADGLEGQLGVGAGERDLFQAR